MIDATASRGECPFLAGSSLIVERRSLMYGRRRDRRRRPNLKDYGNLRRVAVPHYAVSDGALQVSVTVERSCRLSDGACRQAHLFDLVNQAFTPSCSPTARYRCSSFGQWSNMVVGT